MLFGFKFLLVFVLATIIAGIYGKLICTISKRVTAPEVLLMDE